MEDLLDQYSDARLALVRASASAKAKMQELVAEMRAVVARMPAWVAEYEDEDEDEDDDQGEERKAAEEYVNSLSYLLDVANDLDPSDTATLRDLLRRYNMTKHDLTLLGSMRRSTAYTLTLIAKYADRPVLVEIERDANKLTKPHSRELPLDKVVNTPDNRYDPQTLIDTNETEGADARAKVQALYRALVSGRKITGDMMYALARGQGGYTYQSMGDLTAVEKATAEQEFANGKPKIAAQLANLLPSDILDGFDLEVDGLEWLQCHKIPNKRKAPVPELEFAPLW